LDLSKRIWIPVIAVIAAAGAALAVVLVTGGEEASANTVRFQDPTSGGPEPFTPPTDLRGSSRVDVGSGPFGGTGSDLVCDRELLIRSLRARPDRLREWARVAGVNPSISDVANYIRTLRPVTLTRDTRVTNHSFVNGRAAPYQAILQAGTAVLVDEKGVPVARCRCGNPLTEPIFIPEAKCLNCPPRYTPPPPCRPWRECWGRYPKPPPAKPPTAEPSTPQEGQDDQASFSPPSGPQGTAFTLLVSGFDGNKALTITLTRPDGVVENYELTTGPDGSGEFSFPPTDGTTLTGTYTAEVEDPTTGDQATATAELLPAEGEAPPGEEPPPEGGELPPEQQEEDLPVCDPINPQPPCRQE
jgi:hypothetical protein